MQSARYPEGLKVSGHVVMVEYASRPRFGRNQRSVCRTLIRIHQNSNAQTAVMNYKPNDGYLQQERV